MRDLKAILAEIEANDGNYAVRYGLVFHAVAAAIDLGFDAGVMTDTDEPGWPVLYIALPTGQVSWHVPEFAAVWDGHTTEEKYARCREFCGDGK